ncbi:endoribonuclease Dicer homolog 3-like [Apium graveolens]|uniref:endoribonuclease Dicer homolog 3-like n=1 Tax=Apium graveolens TaxID=4045 RepID=UPI003D7ABC69
MDSVIKSCSQACPEALSNYPSTKKQKTCDIQSTTITPDANGSAEHNIIAIKLITTKKGAPRVALYDVCKKKQWPLPEFETTEKKSRSPIVFMDGPEKREGFSSFTSQITLIIPDRCVVVLDGHPRADKKSSLDSACLLMLYELEQRGILSINKS